MIFKLWFFKTFWDPHYIIQFSKFSKFLWECCKGTLSMYWNSKFGIRNPIATYIHSKEWGEVDSGEELRARYAVCTSDAFECLNFRAFFTIYSFQNTTFQIDKCQNHSDKKNNFCAQFTTFPRIFLVSYLQISIM